MGAVLQPTQGPYVSPFGPTIIGALPQPRDHERSLFAS
ncbi:hypothetical protein DB30_03564 [Enhygromyxa salina]|uniref:Uncharacterized protein n=2 Tax=Enhygromyxa salina TaxID=215803 RepID=A0A0C2D1Z7_9BACT|nr:hypothetical protein DB30_03564 [Enhygromyxa salina]